MRAEGSSDASGRTQAQEGIAGLTRTDHATIGHAAADQGATSRAAPGIARDCANIAPRGAGYSLRHTGSI
jgi:hypothetical protein